VQKGGGERRLRFIPEARFSPAMLEQRGAERLSGGDLDDNGALKV
jgi:hypothetical protein